MLNRFRACLRSGRILGAVAASLLLAGCQPPGPRGNIKSLVAMIAPSESPPDPTDSLPCHLDLMADLSLSRVARHYVVTVAVNGKPANLLFDTGAARTMLTPAAADRLGLHRSRTRIGQTVSGVGGQRRAQPYDSDTLQVGVLHGRQWNFLVTDLGLERLGKNLDGLLGADFLSRYDVDIDIPGHRVALFYPEHDCSKPSAYLDGPLYQVALGRTVVPIHDTEAAQFRQKFGDLHATYGTPYLDVTIAGQTLLAVIDSGAPMNMLFPSGTKKLNLGTGDFAKDPVVQAGGIGPAAAAARRHVIDEVDIGNLGLQHVPFAVMDASLARGYQADLLLGDDVLTRIHLWISHTSGTLIMQYPPRPSPPPGGA